MKRRTRNRVLFGIASGGIVVLFLLFIWNYLTLLNSRSNHEMVTHTYKVIQKSDELLTALVDAETGERGFIITEDEKFLQPYYGAQRKTNELLSQLKELTQDNQGQQMRLDSLALLSNQRFHYLDNGISYGLHNEKEKSFLLVNSDVGKRIMDKIRNQVSVFKNEEENLLGQRTEAAEQAAALSFKTLFVASAIVIGLMLVLYFFLYLETRIRRKAEKELFISREWFSKTLISLGDGVITTDANGVISFMNKVAEKLTGLETSEAIGKPLDFVFEIINEYSGLPVPNPIKKALQEDKIVLLANHTLLIRRDKSRLYIDDSAAPIHSDDGRIIGAVLIFRDVSEQAITRKKLAESEQRLQNIINNTTAVITIKDIEGKYLMVNNQFEKNFYLKQEDVIGRTDYDIFPADLSDNYSAVDRKVRETKERIEIELEVMHPDGNIHIYISSKFPLYDNDGKVYAICGISTDITENKRNVEMQHQLQVQEIQLVGERRFRALIENSYEGIIMMNEKAETLYQSPAVERMTGITPEEAAKNGGLNFIHPDDIPGVTALMENVFKNPGQPFFSVHRVKKNGGGWIWTEGTITNLLHYDNVKALVANFRDITERKETEQRTQELLENLQQRNTELKQFAYIISHNLRSPVAKIQGIAELFEEYSGGSELHTNLVKNISHEANHLDMVVKDLNMIISLRESGKEIKESVNFEKELETITQVLSGEIGGANARISTDFREAVSIISVKSYVYSILYNLLSNALKYRSPQRTPEINLRTGKDGKFTWLEVTDNGIGIDLEKNKEKMFGLYKRFHTHIDGKGMGLYLVKTEAESLGGRVGVESKLNEGTSFKVFFPD